MSSKKSKKEALLGEEEEDLLAKNILIIHVCFAYFDE